jgi:hypothetical protein
MSRLFRCILAACVISLAATAGAADDPAAAGAARLLDVGWGKASQALAPAQEEFERLEAAIPGDSRVLYAYSLVLLKHHKYKDAARVLSQAAHAGPTDLPVRRADIWVAVLARRYPTALVAMGQFARTIESEAVRADQDAGQETELRASAEFLGRIFGYLEGPAAFDPDALADNREDVVNRLGTALADDFEEGRRGVLERHDELALRHEQARESARIEGQAEQDRTLERLDTEEADLQVRRSELADSEERARQSLEATLREIDGRLAALDAAFARLEAEAAPYHSAMVDLDRRIGRLLAAADSAQDPGRAVRLRLEADRLSDLYGINERRYAALDGQARQVRGEREAVAGERRASEERFQEELDRLRRESSKLDRTEKRIAADRRKADRPPSGATPPVRALASHSAALATYAPFPLEEERARLLELAR